MDKIKVGPLTYKIVPKEVISYIKDIKSKVFYRQLIIETDKSLSKEPLKMTIFVQMVNLIADFICFFLDKKYTERLAAALLMVLTDNISLLSNGIPKEIKVGGLKYKVILDEDLKNTDEEYVGLISYEECIIRIAAEQAMDAAQIAFIHEMMHGILAYYNIEIEEEEDFISRFSPVLYMVLVDNPEIFKMLKE